ncbi:hypothetical protein ABPS01_09895, partial [Streptococcus sp. ZJ151]|uniref:hypothetical protein n=1 Tax=Streptococcus jiangjianxini TaxID=3161189 RepID=UPI0032EBE82E
DSETDMEIPRIPEIPRSTATQIGPKTKLKFSTGNAEDSTTARVVPSTDSNVAIGSKTELISQVPTDTPAQSRTEINTKSELKTPAKTKDSETDMEIPRIPEIPRSTATQIGPKTKLKFSTGNAEDSTTARVVPSTDSDVAIGSKTELISQVPTDTPKQPNTEIGTKSELKIPETPRSTDTEVGPKTKLQFPTGNAEDSTTARVVPSTASEVAIGSKTELVPQVPTDTPDQSRTEINTKSELKIPETPRSTDTEVGPKTKLKIPSDKAKDSTTARVVPSTASEASIGSKTELAPQVPTDTPEQPNTEIGTKSELKIPETPRSTDTQIGSKTELKIPSGNAEDSTTARVVPSVNSDVAIGPKTELVPQVPTDTSAQSNTEINTKSVLQSGSSVTEHKDSNVAIGAKSEMVPKVPNITPEQPNTGINTKSIETPDSPATDTKDSDLEIGIKSEVSSSVATEVPSSSDIGQKPELKHPEKNHKSASDTASPRILETPRSTSTQVGSKIELSSVPPKGDDAPEARVVSSRKENHVDTKNASGTHYELTDNKAAGKNQRQRQSARLVVKKGQKNVEDSHLQSVVHYCSVALVFLLGSIWGLKKLKKEK